MKKSYYLNQYLYLFILLEYFKFYCIKKVTKNTNKFTNNSFINNNKSDMKGCVNE